MENQHRKIAGYRELSQEELDLMNLVKMHEAAWNSLVDQLRATPSLDQRNVALAATHAEDAYMRAVRAIAQPERLTSVGFVNEAKFRAMDEELSPEDKNRFAHQGTVSDETAGDMA